MAKKEGIGEMSDDELRKLSPEERIRYLKDLAEHKRLQLEEEQRKAQEEIKAASEKIQATEEELDKDIEQERERDREALLSRAKEDNLEELVQAEKIAKKAQEELFTQYKVGTEYKTAGGGEYRSGAPEGIDERIAGYTSRTQAERDELYHNAVNEKDDTKEIYAQKDRGAPKIMSEYSGGVRSGTSLEISENLYKR